MITTDFNTIPKETWDIFLNSHPKGNVFQSLEMVSVYSASKNMSPITIFYFDGKTLSGVLVGAIFKENLGKLSFLTARCIVTGGPLVINDDVDITHQLIHEFKRNVGKKVIYSQFRNIYDTVKIKNAFRDNKFEYIPHLDIHIDTTQSIDSFRETLKPKLRQNVNKALKKGVEFGEIQSIEELSHGYEIIKLLYHKIGLPLPEYSLFLNAFNLLGDKVKFFKATYKNEIIGVRFVLIQNGLVYDWYAGSKQEFYHLYANDFLPYKTIEWCIANPAIELFDFGGAGKPDETYGVRDFKLKFSSNIIELGRYEYVHRKLLFWFAKTGFFILKNCKAQLQKLKSK